MPETENLTADMDPVDGRRIARNLRAILESLPTDALQETISFVDRFELNFDMTVGEAFAEMIDQLDNPTSVNRKFDPAWAIIRSQPGDSSPTGEYWRVRSIVWDSDFAMQEVARLNEINREHGVRYFLAGTKVERRTREHQHILQPIGPEARTRKAVTRSIVHSFTSVVEFNSEITLYEGRIPAFPDLRVVSSTSDGCAEDLRSALQQRIDKIVETGRSVPYDPADIRLLPIEIPEPQRDQVD
ncbi:MAG: hypothetical protein R3A46_16610 [Thermomicrobiales bacterium]